MRLETLLMHPTVQALGRALLQFLWQGFLPALVLSLARTLAPPSAARVRYAVASLTMLTMPIALAITMAQYLRHEPPATSIVRIASSNARIPGEESREALIAPLPTSGSSFGISGWLPGGVVCIWVAGILLLSLRAAGGWMRVQRLKRRVLPASQELADTMTQLKRTLNMSAPVRLYRSAIVQVPTAIGWIRPHIFLPVTTITGLSESQLRAILAHELAHISRHDYLVNLLQTAVETVLFYHPAVWWVGKQMRVGWATWKATYRQFSFFGLPF
jgi:beta-lactamase regulating signal transducer with metallopeptidase domain